MDHNHVYAGDKVWKYTKGLNLQNLKLDILGEGREEMQGRVKPRRENGYILAPD
jgi:hypothetical protein